MKSYSKYYILLALFILVFFLFDLYTGSYSISFKQLFNALINSPMTDSNIKTIVLEFRLPRALTALLTGMGLSLSGLIMQSYFRNPLAGPYVLGVSSGASFGVAVFLLLGSYFTAIVNEWSLTFFALIGAAMVLLIILGFGKMFQSNVSLLIIGLMLSTFLGALINILEFFSKPGELHAFVLWTFGSLNGVEWNEIIILMAAVVVGMLFSWFLIKPLNALLLGEEYAQSMGISLNLLKWQVILITGVLTATITAYCGPIAFIGIATPHLVRFWIKTSNHQILIPLVALTGGLILLICDIIAQVPGFSFVLPINVVTSLLGAPVVIFVILKNIGKPSYSE